MNAALIRENLDLFNSRERMASLERAYMRQEAEERFKQSLRPGQGYRKQVLNRYKVRAEKVALIRRAQAPSQTPFNGIITSSLVVQPEGIEVYLYTNREAAPFKCLVPYETMDFLQDAAFC